MPRHPDTVITPNSLLADARKRLRSPQRPGQHMSRAELADAINTTLNRLHPGRSLSAHYVDHRWVGKLERGEHRWPSHERRAALRQVFGTSTDADLGLYSPRRTPDAVPRHQLQSHPAAPRIALDDALLEGDADAWLRELSHLAGQPARTWPQLRFRMREHLDVLEGLQRDRARPHLARVDARWSEFMSWIADNNISSDGGGWLDRSHRRAAEAEHQPLTAYALMRQSQRALEGGDIHAAIELSRRSLASGPLPARTRALCLVRMAEALATSGNDVDAFTAIAAARRELRGANPRTVDQDDFPRIATCAMSRPLTLAVGICSVTRHPLP